MSKGLTIAIVCICILAACLIACVALFGSGIAPINTGGNPNTPVPTQMPTEPGPTSIPTSSPTTVPGSSSAEPSGIGEQTTDGPKEGSDKLKGYWYGEESMTFGILFITVPADGEFTALCYEDGTADFWCYLFGLEDYGVVSNLPYVLDLTWTYKGGTSYEAVSVTETDGGGVKETIIPFTCDGNLLYMEINPVELGLIENDLAKAAANKNIPIHLYKQAQ